MIKAVIWDLGGVLFTNGTNLFVEKISSKYKLKAEEVMVVMDGPIGSLYRENKISKEEFWTKALQELKIYADPNELNNEWIDEYHLIEGTRDLILYMRRFLPQYYLSDNVKERVERINQKTGFLSWFDGGLFSYEVDVRKPDPKFYKLGLKLARVKPENALFIDDKETALIPARDMGIKTILFTSPEQCKQELIKLWSLTKDPL